MPSSMKAEYANVPKGGRLQRSSFNLSENHKTTFDGDELIPIYWTYAYPGDVFRGDVQAFVRMSTPLDFPLMDNMKLTVHWYSVPIRILWDNFRKFYGERDNPSDSIDFTLPELGTGTQSTDTTTGVAKLMRYMGCPVVPTNNVDLADVGAAPFRAYYSIWNWHYRDQQQQTSLTFPTGDGPDNNSYTIQRRGKRHDLYTSALPAPQRGEAVTIDVESDANVNEFVGAYFNGLSTPGYRRLDSGASQVDVSTSSTDAEDHRLYAGTINDLRNAVAIQQFLERDNRYGQRFDEQIFAHFGVEFNDIRIAPVYLGGGSGYINTSAIPNTSGTGNQGDLAAIAHGSLDGARFTYAFDEPSILMALANVSADITYQRGLERKHSYRSRYDMFYPEFTRIGDQAMLTKEIYYNNDANDDTVFGYVPRYEELRTGVNKISGEFSSQLTTGSLDTWHLAEELGSAPVLGNTWIRGTSPWDRVQQVATADDFLADFQINIRAARALPINGVPGLARL